MNKYLLGALVALTSVAAMAQETSAASQSDKGLLGLSAALAIAIAAATGGIAQSRAVSAALDGIARNPAAQGKILRP